MEGGEPPAVADSAEEMVQRARVGWLTGEAECVRGDQEAGRACAVPKASACQDAGGSAADRRIRRDPADRGADPGGGDIEDRGKGLYKAVLNDVWLIYDRPHPSPEIGRGLARLGE